MMNGFRRRIRRFSKILCSRRLRVRVHISAGAAIRTGIGLRRPAL
jgi:hypothetical protein